MGEIMTERRRGSLSVLAIPWVVAVRAVVSSEFRNERFNGREERARAQTPGAIYRCRVAFRPICDFEVNGGMRATQRVAEVTWTGHGGGEGDAVRMSGDESGGELFFVFYQKHRPFFKLGSVRAAVAAGVVVHRSRQRRYEY